MNMSTKNKNSLYNEAGMADETLHRLEFYKTAHCAGGFLEKAEILKKVGEEAILDGHDALALESLHEAVPFYIMADAYTEAIAVVKQIQCIEKEMTAITDTLKLLYDLYVTTCQEEEAMQVAKRLSCLYITSHCFEEALNTFELCFSFSVHSWPQEDVSALYYDMALCYLFMERTNKKALAMTLPSPPLAFTGSREARVLERLRKGESLEGLLFDPLPYHKSLIERIQRIH